MSRTTKPYIPRPGSVPDIVIRHLREHGGTMHYADAAVHCAKPRNNIEPSLRAAIQHGALVLVAPATVQLAEGAPPAAAAPTTAPRKARRGQAGRDRANSARRVRAQVVEPPPAPGPVACLWDDGDIVLHGLTPNADGSTATITQEHARRLHGFLHRLFGPPELVATYPAPAPRGPLLTHDGR